MMEKMIQQTTPDRPVMDDESLEAVITGKPKRNARKALFLLISVAVVAIAGFVITLGGLLGKIKVKNLTGGSPLLALPKFNPNTLKGEGDGRINILILGMGGVNHKGGLLTDTIMVLSVDPKNKEAAFLSVPRDLYIARYPKPLTGGGKINNVHAFGEQNKIPGGGPAAAKQAVADLLDLPIHYFFRADFEGFKKIVDVLGGVTVQVEKGFYDPLFPAPNMIDYEPFTIAAGRQKMDGKTALKYARSRHGSNGEGSDFARSKRQQQVLVAIKEKAFSANVLANPSKLIEITNILGNHIKLDLSVRELERIYEIAKNIPKDKMVSKVLDNSSTGPLYSESTEQGYFLKPRDPTGEEIKKIAHDIFKDPYLSDEAAAIEIISGSTAAGAADRLAKELSAVGYKIIAVKKSEEASSTTKIIDRSGGKKPVTVNYLSRRLNTKVSFTSVPSTADVVVILGSDYVAPKNP